MKFCFFVSLLPVLVSVLSLQKQALRRCVHSRSNFIDQIRNNLCNSDKHHIPFHHSRSLSLLASERDESDRGNSNNDNDNDNKESRPPIIPFDFDSSDFMREDIRLQQQLQQQQKAQSGNVQPPQMQPVIIRTPSNSGRNNNKNAGIVEDGDNARPTGYDNAVDEVDPNDQDQVPTPEQLEQYNDELAQFRESRNPVVKLLFDAYVGTPYDSKNKREARFVVRSITLISAAIGIIFTGVYYLFPGKFISVRSEADLTSRYMQQPKYDPDQLLQDALKDNMVPFERNLEKSDFLRENSIERFGESPRDPDKENFAKPTMKL